MGDIELTKEQLKELVEECTLKGMNIGMQTGVRMSIESIEKLIAKIPDLTVDEILEHLNILKEMSELRASE